jgi:hypothetical protein
MRTSGSLRQVLQSGAVLLESSVAFARCADLAPTPPADGPFPLVMFSPGWGGPAWSAIFLGTRLASHGFVVAIQDWHGRRGAALAGPRTEDVFGGRAGVLVRVEVVSGGRRDPLGRAPGPWVMAHGAAAWLGSETAAHRFHSLLRELVAAAGVGRASAPRP